jgi:hypothetical protein
VSTQALAAVNARVSEDLADCEEDGKQLGQGLNRDRARLELQAGLLEKLGHLAEEKAIVVRDLCARVKPERRATSSP